MEAATQLVVVNVAQRRPAVPNASMPHGPSLAIGYGVPGDFIELPAKSRLDMQNV
jgi:hypothetical protein